jgi:predicted permease
MHSLRQFGTRFAALFRQQQLEQEMNEEMRAHLEMSIEENVRRGMAPEEARYAALRSFGGVEQAKENYREQRGLIMLETLLQDLRFAIRQLRKSPGFASAAIVVLALGMCASVSIFAFVDAALIKPLPYRNPSRLVGVYESVKIIPRSNLSYPDYLDWKRLNKVFTSLEAWNGTGYLFKTTDGTQPLPGVRVSDGFFRTLGVTPMLGRDFDAGEDSPSTPRTVLLSYGVWQKWFGGKEDVLGQSVTLSEVSYTIIGVLPETFSFAPRGPADFWTTIHDPNSCEKSRGCHNLYGVARLKDGVSVQTAQADMTSIAIQLEKQYPETNHGQGAAVIPLNEAIVGNVRPILLMLLSGAGLLLLIACVNVASLLLVRSESRKREIAVRAALGASPGRLIRQFITEGLVMGIAASVLGIVAASWAMQILIKLIPTTMLTGMPYLEGLGLNFRVVAFAIGISLIAAAMFSITPALRLPLSHMREALAEGDRSCAGTLWRRLGANLVVGELAMAMVLLVSAGLLGKSLYRLLHVDLGFQPDHLASLRVAAPPSGYGKDEQEVALARQILSRIANIPGIKSVGISSVLPVSFNGNTDWIRFVGRPYHGEHNEVNERDVSSDYFTTLHARLLRGRYFTDADDVTKPRVVIINQKLADMYFPGEDPIGRQIGNLDLDPKSLREIVGVVDNIKEGPLDSEIWPAEYASFNQSPDTFFGVIVRTSQAAESILPALSATIHRIDPKLGTMGEATMNERIGVSPSAYLHRSSAWLVGGFAAMALVLSLVGLYGVVAYSVSRRTREIGVRMALGAQRRSVYRLILKEAAWLAAAGIALGIIGSLAAATLMRGLLFGTATWDMPTLAGVSAALAVAALLAAFIPAHRAAKVDPMVALRYE